MGSLELFKYSKDGRRIMISPKLKTRGANEVYKAASKVVNRPV
jgi:hypothetical protein